MTIVGILVAVFLCGPAFSQAQSGANSWNSVFQASWRAHLNGDFRADRNLSERGWLTVQRAGPLATGYADGVEQAYAGLVQLSGTLRGDQIYDEALIATPSAQFPAIRLDILLRLAFRMKVNREVKSLRTFREALALAESLPRRPKFFGQILVELADLLERMGNPKEAGVMRRRAASGLPSTPLPAPRYIRGDPPQLGTAVFEEIKALIYESDQLILKGDFDLGTRRLEEAFSRVEADPARAGLLSDFFTGAAGYFSRKGRTEEAAAILELNLALAERCLGPQHRRWSSS